MGNPARVICREPLRTSSVSTDDQLDASFNLDSFYFETMSFGEQVITPPPASTDFVAHVDLRPANDLIVRIEAILDVNTRLATWRFSSIDPETGQPVDPFSVAGFLPPNANPPEGEGSVSFSVELEEGVVSGTTIRNNALIIFDQNEAIDTGEWLNRIDKAKPSSLVQPLAATVTTETFPVQWSGTDADSGISNFSIFVSEDDGPFELWIRNTTATSAEFTGEEGKSYGFFSLARDNTSNAENIKSEAEATTTVIVNTDSSPPVTTAALSQPPNTAGWHNADLSVTLTATDDDSGVKEISWTVTLGQSVTGGASTGNSVIIPITAEGISTIAFFAVETTDAVGNTAGSGVTYTVSFGVQALYDQTRQHNAKSVIPITIRLTDAGGTNMSAEAVIVTAVGTSLLSEFSPPPPKSPGNTNPENRFRFTELDSGDGYIYNLDTTGLASGTHVLIFTVAGDPVVHTVQFRIR